MAHGNWSFWDHFTKKLARTDRTLIRTGGDDDREVIDLAQGGVKKNAVIHILGAGVMDHAHETDLTVENEQRGVIPADPLERECNGWADANGS